MQTAFGAILSSVSVLLAASAAHARGLDVSAAEIEAVQPGSILRMWPLSGGVRSGYKGYRILYRSTGMRNEPIAVTGAVMYPEGAPAGPPRNIVAWAHPTSGVVTRCAPTLMPDFAGNIQGIDYFTDAGYVIVATDYPGLGNPGHHPYLIGTSEARTVLDSVRAARTLKSAHAGDRFVVWGHSQGGHAALHAGIEAAAYAPELKLLGVAAAAPATDLVKLFEANVGTDSGRSLAVMAIYAWSRVFGFPMTRFVAPENEQSAVKLASDCLLTLADLFREEHDQQAVARDFLASDPANDPVIRKILVENTPGLLPAEVPVFISQGTADDVVLPPITQAYAKALCAAGSKVRFHTIKGGSHMWAGRDSAYAAYRWMSSLFKGRPPRSDC